MFNVFICYLNISPAAIFGVGSYIEQLKIIFNPTIYNVYLVDTLAEEEEFAIENLISGNILIKFPKNKFISGINSNDNGFINLLSLYIKNIENSVFFFNYYFQYKLSISIKRRYPNVNTIGCIHFFSWVWYTDAKEGELIRSINFDGDNGDINSVREMYNIEKEYINYVDYCIVLSKDSYNLLNTIYDISLCRLLLIPNGISDVYTVVTRKLKKKLRTQHFIHCDEKILLYVGRLDQMKGLPSLIKAFGNVLNKYYNLRLVIVGDGNFSEMISNAIQYSSSKITYTGRIALDEVLKWYQIADIGILPTLSEECSFVGIEMMMHGLPIISTNGRGVRNMFHHMKNCLNVDCQSGREVFENELSEAILKLLDSETLCNELRKKSRQWYLDNYQLKFMQQKYLSLIEDITK